MSTCPKHWGIRGGKHEGDAHDPQLEFRMEMRICSPQLGISPYSNLGGAVYDREILKRLAKLGVEVEILLPKGELHEDVPGWRLYKTPRHLFYYYEYNLIFLPYLFKLWRKPGLDLLRVHSPTIGPASLLFKKITKVPAVAHYHHLENKWTDHLLNKLVIKGYDQITTDSYFCREQIAATYGIDLHNIAVVYPGVDPKYKPCPGNKRLKSRLGVDDEVILLYLGVLEPRKNLIFLLDVFTEVVNTTTAVSVGAGLRPSPPTRPKVSRRLGDLRSALRRGRETLAEPKCGCSIKSVHKTILVIAGTGSQEAELKGYVEKLGLDKYVIFTGYVPEEEKVDLYNLADIFVLPSLLEGFGMVAAEAMACGKPVVASNASSLPEVVEDGKTGLLANPACVDDFTDQVLRLLRDESLRRRLGGAGRERVLRNFSWDVAARKTLEVYQRVFTAK